MIFSRLPEHDNTNLLPNCVVDLASNFTDTFVIMSERALYYNTIEILQTVAGFRSVSFSYRNGVKRKILK